MRGRGRLALLALLLLLFCDLASAAGRFSVERAATRVDDGVLVVDADLRLRLGGKPLDALTNGVPLVVEIEMQVLGTGFWLLSETVASVRQRFRFQYHALSEQYLVHNLNTGEQQSFSTRLAAGQYMGRLRGFPLVDTSLLDDGGPHTARIRVSLDIDALPVPLRPFAYLSFDWWLSSDWYEWSL